MEDSLKTRLFAFVAVLFLVPWLGSAADDETGHKGATAGKLQKKNGMFAITLVNPDADLSRYLRIYTEDVVVKFRPGSGAESRSATGTNMRKRVSKANSKAEEQLAMFREVMTLALERGLAKHGRFEISGDRGADTMVVRTSLVDLVSKIRKTGRAVKAGKLLAEGTIVFELVDAETGIVLARMGGRREAVASGSSAVESSELPPPWGEIELWAQHAVADFLAEVSG